jgi:hypothetical protein
MLATVSPDLKHTETTNENQATYKEVSCGDRQTDRHPKRFQERPRITPTRICYASHKPEAPSFI